MLPKVVVPVKWQSAYDSVSSRDKSYKQSKRCVVWSECARRGVGTGARRPLVCAHRHTSALLVHKNQRSYANSLHRHSSDPMMEQSQLMTGEHYNCGKCPVVVRYIDAVPMLEYPFIQLSLERTDWRFWAAASSISRSDVRLLSVPEFDFRFGAGNTVVPRKL